jgi:hypothetical protein
LKLLFDKVKSSSIEFGGDFFIFGGIVKKENILDKFIKWL